MTFRAAIARGLYDKVASAFDTLSFKSPFILGFIESSHSGPRTIQELESILYGSIEPACGRALRHMQTAASNGDSLAALALPLIYPSIRDRMELLNKLTGLVEAKLIGRSQKYKKFQRSKVTTLNTYSQDLLEAGELFHGTMIQWDRYRYDSPDREQSIEIAVANPYGLRDRFGIPTQTLP